MKEEYELNIGDEVYADYHYHGLSKLKVERLTNTLIVLSNDTKIRKPFSEYNYAVGDSGLSRTAYRPVSDELDKLYLRQQLIKRCSKINFNELPTDKLQQIGFSFNPRPIAVK